MEEKEEKNNTSATGKYKKAIFLLVAIVVFAGLIYVSVSFFGLGEGNKVAAKVNGNQILQSELQKRFDQDKKTAVSQGVDTSNPETVKQVKSKILKS